MDSNNTPTLFEPHLIPENATLPRNDDIESIRNMCHKYMNYHVIVSLKDGSQQEGIIESMNDQGIIMLVPEDIDGDDDRQFFGYGYRPRFRRFRRFLFPFFFFVPPFIYPYPYY
ncbi:hypothetical protein EWH91_08335 [Sporolactobacillus sp. THM19-2]|jgi:hypothetical protein|nr:hypothetical protein EWH91_08335 [Sporolactobacillus sp. THM19-2]